MFGVQGYLLSSITQRSVGMLETNRKRGRTWRGDRWGLKTVGTTPLSNMLNTYRLEVAKIQYPLANFSVHFQAGGVILRSTCLK